MIMIMIMIILEYVLTNRSGPLLLVSHAVEEVRVCMHVQ
jgi:hypothetical protein